MTQFYVDYTQPFTVELQLLEHLRNHENICDTGVVLANEY